MSPSLIKVQWSWVWHFPTTLNSLKPEHPDFLGTQSTPTSWHEVPLLNINQLKDTTKVNKSPEFIRRAGVTILKEITSGGIHQDLVVARAGHHIFASSTWKIWFTLLQFVVIWNIFFETLKRYVQSLYFVFSCDFLVFWLHSCGYGCLMLTHFSGPA